MHRPVCLAHFKDPHEDSFVSPVRQPQVVGQFHFRLLQGVPVDIQEQADPHLRRVHRTQFDLRITAALGCDIAAAFDDILLRKRILCSGNSCDLSCPVILPGVPLYRLRNASLTGYIGHPSFRSQTSKKHQSFLTDALGNVKYHNYLTQQLRIFLFQIKERVFIVLYIVSYIFTTFLNNGVSLCF